MKLANVLFFALYCMLELKFVLSQRGYGCVDRLDRYTCYSWSTNGMCTDPSYRNLATDNCQKTCGLCWNVWTSNNDVSTTDEKACRDNRKTCSKWIKHCQQNSAYYKFMTENCRRTCLFCEDEECSDINKRCKKYQARGYCDVNHMYHEFMKKNCEMTCRLCLPITNQEKQVTTHIEDYKKEFFCDFEIDECDWVNQPFEDTADWSVGSNKHAPLKGFNKSKQYLYLDSSIYEDYYANLLLPWQLVLPDKVTDKGKMCFHFMYMMNDGKITISQKATPTSRNKFPVTVVKFTSEGKALTWKYAKIDVHVSENYELIIKGVKGAMDSYLGIDHIFFTQGECY